MKKLLNPAAAKVHDFFEVQFCEILLILS